MKQIKTGAVEIYSNETADRLSEHYNAVKDLNHNEVMSEAGYSTRPQSTPQQLMSKISEQVVSTVEGKTSAVARAVTTMTSRSSLAGLGAALATTYGLEELNIDPNVAESGINPESRGKPLLLETMTIDCASWRAFFCRIARPHILIGS